MMMTKRRAMATISTTTTTTTTTKLMILFYFLINILHTSHSIVTKRIDFHLPDGRATSPYYPPLSAPVFGWLLCVSLSNGGRLRPPNNLFIIFVFFQSSPDTMR
jgi:hypothetical protein